MLRKIAELDALWIGEPHAVCVEGRPILLIREEDGVRAFEDRCPHAGVRLSSGRLAGGVLTCPAHEWQFDARSGCGINPRRARLRGFPVHIEGGAVFVELPAPGRTENGNGIGVGAGPLVALGKARPEL